MLCAVAYQAVAYQLGSGEGSFAYSGDTSYHEPFWSALNSVRNLRYLMIETNYLDHEMKTQNLPATCDPNSLRRG